MPITWSSKRKTTEPVTEDTVSAAQVDTLSPVEKMEMIERIAEATPLHAFPPVGLRKAGEVKELNIENPSYRNGGSCRINYQMNLPRDHLVTTPPSSPNGFPSAF